MSFHFFDVSSFIKDHEFLRRTSQVSPWPPATGHRPPATGYRPPATGRVHRSHVLPDAATFSRLHIRVAVLRWPRAGAMHSCTMTAREAKRGRSDAVTEAATEAPTEQLQDLLQCPVCYVLPEGIVNQVRSPPPNHLPYQQ